MAGDWEGSQGLPSPAVVTQGLTSLLPDLELPLRRRPPTQHQGSSARETGQHVSRHAFCLLME